MSTSAPIAVAPPGTLILEAIRPPRLPFGPCSPEEVDQLQAMTHSERVAALSAGELSYAQCFKWASWRPWEVPLVNGEFAFIAAFDPDCCEPETRQFDDSQTCDVPHVLPEDDTADGRVRETGDELPVAA